MNSSLFSRQPNFRLSRFVTLVRVVDLFKPLYSLETISELCHFLAVSLIIGFLGPSLL